MQVRSCIDVKVGKSPRVERVFQVKCGAKVIHCGDPLWKVWRIEFPSWNVYDSGGYRIEGLNPSFRQVDIISVVDGQAVMHSDRRGKKQDMRP
jgi:hypothetical protein